MLNPNPRVLLADDNEELLTYMSIILTRLGFEVVPARDGEEAVKLTRILKPSLVLMDVIMPKLDGMEVLKNLRNDSHLYDIPVVIFSASTKAQTKELALALGAADYLTKPISVRRLYGCLQGLAMIGVSHARQKLRIDLRTRVKLTHMEKTESYFSCQLSEDGIYLSMPHDLPKGDRVMMTIQLGCSGETMDVQGEVLYNLGIYEGVIRQSPGVGLRFVDMDFETRRRLIQFLEYQLAGDLVEHQPEKILCLDDPAKSASPCG